MCFAGINGLPETLAPHPADPAMALLPVHFQMSQLHKSNGFSSGLLRPRVTLLDTWGEGHARQRQRQSIDGLRDAGLYG